MIRQLQLLNCPIFLGPLAESLPAWLQNQRHSGAFILTDSNTQKHCHPLLPAMKAVKFTVGAADPNVQIESIKTLASCEVIWQAMFEARLDRQGLVVNLGGGVLGDMGGFCAATYKRGIAFIQIPTSLLAMNDAAIGGKLGVNFQGIKNAVGVFQSPLAIFIDPVFLKTLPERELRSGFAEMLKHARIGDPALWQKLCKLPLERLSTSETISTETWLELLKASIAVKIRIVEQDPREAGIRALLNFGHTVGHALESYFLKTETPISHGEAIAIGMFCESWSEHEAGRALEIAEAILRLFPHRPIPAAAFPALWKLMEQDKKNASGAVRMAVPDAEPFSMRWLTLSRAETERRLNAWNALSTGPSV